MPGSSLQSVGLKKGRRTISPKKSALLKARGITKVSYDILYDLYLSTTVFRTCRGGSSSFQINLLILPLSLPLAIFFSHFSIQVADFFKQVLYCTILISHKLFNPKALFVFADILSHQETLGRPDRKD